MAKKSQRSKSSRTRDDKDNQDNPSLLPGWPGYRTRDGRSGYDPIDTRTEAAHTAGTIVQRLFTGEVRHPVYLFLLGLAGLILITPLILAISEMWNGNLLSWNAWVFILITGIGGLIILINFIKNLIKMVTRKERQFPQIKSPEEDE
jgi:hypothetical protein